MRRLGIIFLLAITFPAAACVQLSERQAAPPLERIRPLATTRAEVLDLLGPPDVVETAGQTVRYLYRRHRQETGWVYAPTPPGLLAHAVRSEIDTLIVSFEDGTWVVTSVEWKTEP